MVLASRAFSVVVAVVALGVSSCAKKDHTPAPVPDGTVALVGGRPITEADLEAHIQRLPASMRGQYRSPAQRRQLLDALIRTELLVREAERLGYDKDPAYRQVVKQQLVSHLLERALEAAAGGQTVSDTEAERHYREHPAEFTAPGQVRASAIVVPDRKRADRLLRAARGLRKGDARGFALLAAKHSIDAPSRDNQGDLGWLERGASIHPPTVTAAAFALREPGDLSEAVETERGVYILRLTERRAAATRPFDEVRHEILQRLDHERRRRQSEALLTRSRANHEVQVFDERLGATAATAAPARADGPLARRK
jgi:peptidyl-prolyl cis-trans isomerase C